MSGNFPCSHASSICVHTLACPLCHTLASHTVTPSMTYPLCVHTLACPLCHTLASPPRVHTLTSPWCVLTLAFTLDHTLAFPCVCTHWHPLYGIPSLCAHTGMPSRSHTSIPPPPCVHTLLSPLSVHILASPLCVYTLAFPRCVHHADFPFSESRVFS